TLDVEVQYLRVTMLGANRGRAGVKEIKVKKDTTEGDEWVVVTPTPEPSPEPTEPSDEWAVVTPTPTPTPTDTATSVSISSLSASHAPVGTSITITGTGFGSSQGDSKVTFGERLNEQGWAPCARTASTTSWSDTQIVCTVPAMSPGKAGEPDTYHSVYVTVGGEMSNSSDFYIDPVTTITTGTSTDTAYTVIDSTRQTWIPSTGTVSSGHSMGVWPRSGAADVLFDGVTFTSTNQYIDAHVAGALTLGEGRSHKRLTFLNCTFTGNQGQGGTHWYGVTGVKFWNNPPGQGDCTDISFIGCDFGTEESGGFSGMGIEQVGSVPSPRTAIIGCTFEGKGSGSEPISFGSSGDLYALVADCVIEGMGDDPRTAWRFVFESNEAHYIEFRDSQIWHFSGVCFNLNQRDSDGVPATGIDPHILIKNVDVDFTRITQENPSVNGKHVMFSLGATSHVQFKDCTFNTGDEDHYLASAGSANPSWEAPNFRTCQYTDFTGSTIEGHVSHSSWPVAPYVPETAVDYWSYASNIHPTNIMPELAR
ncbi:MAG: IPT/TIG domain-containing protein, partial [Thermoleophilia bacterium]|nr:IPT/TIG domain-containing protein [Thermoleophilia bacterium]